MMDNASPSIRDVFDSLRADGNSYVDLQALSSKLIEYFSTGDPVEDECLEEILKTSLNATDGKIYYEEFYKCFCAIINQQNINSSRRQSVTSFIEDEASHFDNTAENSGYNFMNEECFESPERKNSRLNNNSLNVSASVKAHSLLSSEDYAEDMPEMRDSTELQSLLHHVDELNHKIEQLNNENNFLKDKSKEFEEREIREKEENQKLREKIILLEEQLRENQSTHKEELLSREKETDRKLNKLSQQHESEVDEYQAKLETVQGKLELLSTQIIRKDEDYHDLKEKLKETIKEHRLDQDALREKLNEESAQIIHNLQLQLDEANEKISELEALILDLESINIKSESTDGVSRMNSLDVNRRDSTVSGTASRSRSASRLISMTSDLEEVVQRLTAENRELTEEINDYKLEVAALRITEGQPRPEVRYRSDTATENFAQELESYGTQQLKDALSNEKETVSRLQDYVNHLLMQIVENYPKLLELV